MLKVYWATEIATYTVLLVELACIESYASVYRCVDPSVRCANGHLRTASFTIQGRTALHVAAGHAHCDTAECVVKLLILKGADVNAKDNKVSD